MGKEIYPVNKVGLEDYKFVIQYGRLWVYHNVEHKTPHGEKTKGWLSCSEGWDKRPDGKWYETVQCGWGKSRVAETMEDIFDYYRS